MPNVRLVIDVVDGRRNLIGSLAVVERSGHSAHFAQGVQSAAGHEGTRVPLYRHKGPARPDRAQNGDSNHNLLE